MKIGTKSVLFGAHRIAIPKYTVLPHLVSQTINQEKLRIAKLLKTTISPDLASNLKDLVDGSSPLTISELQQSAKSFYSSELEKELKVYCLIHPGMEDVHKALSPLHLSVKNQKHFSSMVDCIYRLVITKQVSLYPGTTSI